MFASSGVSVKGKQIVFHKRDSTDDSCNWIEYWQRCKDFSSLEDYICPSCMKPATDLVGGHIVCDSKTYIVPVCRSCNSRYKDEHADRHPFYVNEDDMVDAPKD